MNGIRKSLPINGYFILRPMGVGAYKGVDREHFEPELPSEEEVAVTDIDEGGLIWPLCAKGWRRNAYRLFEENMVQEWADDYMISNLRAAQEILHLIEPNMGRHEIVECLVQPRIEIGKANAETSAKVVGYDVAYPGGDYYSAVLNGLVHENRNQELEKKYSALLNNNGLFKEADPVDDYLRDFRNAVESEEDQDFCIYRVSIP